MFKTLSFSFENDFQRLQIEASLDASTGAVQYRILESENVDFVQKCDAWTAYEGDSKEWMAALESLDIGSWGCAARETNERVDENRNVFPGSEVKWSLTIHQSNDEEGVLQASGKGSDSYPVNFTDLLELLKKLLGLPVLLLEL